MNQKADKIQTRLKKAELASGVGAGLLGVGLGVFLAQYLRASAALILAVGAMLHGWGMFDKHQIESKSVDTSVWWADLLYWLCWAALLFLIVFIVATDV